MTKKAKQIESLRSNLKTVRFNDACKIAERLGFSRQGGKGSHRTYGRSDEPLLLNFQNRGWVHIGVPGETIAGNGGKICSPI